jgi:membrane protease YdiL (CAAX protease family)
VSTTSTELPAPIASRRRVVVVTVAGLLAVVVAVVVSTFTARLARGGVANLVQTATIFVVDAALLLAIVRRARLDARAIGLGLEGRDMLRFFGGAAFGVAMIALTLGIAAIFGGCHVAIAPRAHWPLASSFALHFASTSFQATFEEVAFRAGLVGVIALAFRREIAIAVPALLFGLAHAGNQGASIYSIANTVIAALVFEGLFLLPTLARRDGRAPSLATSSGFHIAWNFALAAILGATVSGGASSARFLEVTIPAGTWSGGAYGIEASPATTITYGIAAAVLLAAVVRGRSRRNLPGADAPPE